MIVEGDPFTLDTVVFGFKNIFFTLFLGLAAIAIIKKHYNNQILNYLKWIAITIFPIIGAAFNVDYRAYGVLMILCFYLFRGHFSKIAISILILNGVFYFIGYISSLQLLSLLALLLIFVYNRERGNGSKYFFYIFYPFNLVVLYGIKSLMML